MIRRDVRRPPTMFDAGLYNILGTNTGGLYADYTITGDFDMKLFIDECSRCGVTVASSVSDFADSDTALYAGVWRGLGTGPVLFFTFVRKKLKGVMSFDIVSVVRQAGVDVGDYARWFERKETEWLDDASRTDDWVRAAHIVKDTVRFLNRRLRMARADEIREVDV